MVSPARAPQDAPVLYREGYDYYRTPRGQHPRSENKWLVQSMDRIAQFDAYAKIDMTLRSPLLMIAGSEADTRYVSEEAIAKAAEPKALFITDGHADPPLRPRRVRHAGRRQAEFFGYHLAAWGSGAAVTRSGRCYTVAHGDRSPRSA